jgi:hypothetical protein
MGVALMTKNQMGPITRVSLIVVVTQSVLFGVAQAQAPNTSATQLPDSETDFIRVENSGEFDIEGIWLVFPRQEIEFGEIPAGTTSEYVAVSRGVYNDIRFRLIIDGGLYTQYRLDGPMFVQLMEGSKFTMNLALVEPRRNFAQGRFVVQAIELRRDE